jgi:DNA-binding GntR family transcriptional regulator
MDMRRSDQIAETLEQLVFSGRFEDGARLDEVKLAEEFEVSRTPIREALQVLVASGLAQQIPRRGVFVRQPGPVELMEMFETMAEIEASCARFAAMRMTDADLAELVAANEACHAAMVAASPVEYYSENEVFHRLIYRGCYNGYLEMQAIWLQNRLRAYRKIQLKLRGRLSQSMTEHSEILAALQAGDAEAAAQAMRAHVAVQGEKFHQLRAGMKT